jgi:poly-gamma-glutamate system protein
MYIGFREKFTLVTLAGVALLGYALFNWFGLGARPGDYAYKVEASRRTLAGEMAIAAIKDNSTVASAVAGDDVQAAMIGLSTSAITTDPGSLRSKVTATNPNFAGAIVSMLRQAGVGKGDVVAVSYTGSFPALDISTITAVETLGAEPIIISSVGASTWGANDPDLTILDMESLLFDKGIIKHKSIETSIGGDFKSRPMTSEGRRLALDAMKRNNVPLASARNIPESVDSHVASYRRVADGRPIKAFVNVGGGLASKGFGAGFDPGLNAASPGGDIVSGGLIERMQHDGVPAINLVDIKKLAEQYKLPVNPATTPDVGQGGLYRDWLQLRIVAGLLVLALTGVYFGARFIALAPATDDAVDTYFGTAPRTFRAWIHSFGVRWPSRTAPQETPIEK